MDNLHEKAKAIRRTVIEMANRSKSPHVGSCLSCVDILTSLYFNRLKLEPWEERDIFILSKGHAAMGLYSTLAVKGILDHEAIMGYYKNGGTLPAHLDRTRGKGIEVSSGSLGHGFNMGIGMAFGYKRRGCKRRVYSIIGDGESQEGSIWEGALFAPGMGLDNFTVVIDHNNLQGYGRPSEISNSTTNKQKWEAFGWHAIDVDGHDLEALQQAFDESASGKPKAIIARTIKGKGVSFMEDELVWHYFVVTDEHMEKALDELR